MVKVKQIEFHNYCGYRNMSFDFTESGKIKPLAVFFGPNGCGKSTGLDAVRLLTQAHYFNGRDNSLIFRKLTYHPDYDPTYGEFSVSTEQLEIIGRFDVDGEERSVILSGTGIVLNELPRKTCPSEHAYFIDADHPMNMHKFQLDAEMEHEFMDLAETVYELPCHLLGKVSDSGREFFTDFVIEKYNTRVHFKRMSDGERKIATLLSSLCSPGYIKSIDIVLLDNIEMHIYFKRHGKLIDKLLQCFPNKQFLTTTHSGTLIEHVRTAYSPSYLYDIEQYRLLEKV